MTQCRKTTVDELYGTLVDLITAVTKRPCWRKTGIQAQPFGPYATVYLEQGPSAAQDVIEEELSEDQESYSQFPVGLTRMECEVEFKRNAAAWTAQEAAIRFRQSLQLESRFFDLWRIAGLVGEIRFIDVSAMFRGEPENRAQVRFGLYADIGAPPLDEDNGAGVIDSVETTVYKETDDPPPFADKVISRPQE